MQTKTKYLSDYETEHDTPEDAEAFNLFRELENALLQAADHSEDRALLRSTPNLSESIRYTARAVSKRNPDAAKAILRALQTS